MAVDIGIDLGTDRMRAYIKGRGVVLAEPSLIAADLYTGEVKAVGKEALIIAKRSGYGGVRLVRPVQRGVIQNYAVTERIIKYCLGKALGKRLFMRPHVTICVPCQAADAQKGILERAALFAGARDVRFMEAPLAAGLGAGIDIGKPCGNMVVDIGAGRTDIAVISSGKAAVSLSPDIGGGDFDEAIYRHIRKKHGLITDKGTCEDVKIKIGTACPSGGGRVMRVGGREVLTGICGEADVTASEIGEALEGPALSIVGAILSALETAPQRLSDDIKERGILLTGGGSLLRGLERLIEEKTGIDAVAANDPVYAAAAGAGMTA